MISNISECRLEPEAVELADEKRYYITQPGSSVATSLIEGEAKQKNVGILHIREGSENKLHVTRGERRPPSTLAYILLFSHPL